MLFAAYIIVISWGMLGKDLDQFAVSDVNSEISNQKSAISNQTVATIRDTADVEWAKQPQASQPAASAANNASIARSEPLAITSGLVELQLNGGTTLLIEGPAQWTIDGENQATLKRGKLIAKVPQQAIGFMLETPTTKIVDLGTEFGVVQTDGVTEINVFRGRVDTQPRGVSLQPIRLSAGQALRMVAGRSNPERFEVSAAKFAALRERLPEQDRPNEQIVLFRDNFDVAATRDDINPGPDDTPGRQGGLLRRLTYIEPDGCDPFRTQLGAVDRRTHSCCRAIRKLNS